jgi:hypothetical protein
MRQFLYLVVLMALSSSAQAGNSFSFVVAGHRIAIEAPRDCSSPSCVSVSIPGIYETGGGRDRDDDLDDTSDASDAAAPVKPPAARQQQVSSPAIIQPASKPAIEPVASAPPPPVAGVTATAAPEIAAAPPSRIQPANTEQPKPLQPKPLPVRSSLPVKSSADTPTQVVPPAPAPHPVQVLQETDDDPSDAPLGDWQTEGNKGSVRIERCGSALCGYVLNPSSNANGETVLINMKPKTAHLLRDHRHAGTGFASGRSLRTRPVFLFGQCLEPNRCQAGEARDHAAGVVGAKVVTTKLAARCDGRTIQVQRFQFVIDSI